MPGLSPLAAIGPVAQLGPHSVELRGRTLRDECAIEAQICWLRGDVVRLACEALSVLSEDARELAAADIVKLIRFRYSGATNADASRWLSCFEGRIFSVWLSIRHSGIGLQQATELICQEIDSNGERWLENVEFGIDMACGTASFQSFAEIRRIFDCKPRKVEDCSFPSYDDVFTSLQKEPFNKSWEEVVGMTMHQIGLLIKDKDGELDERESDLANQRQVKDGLERPEQYEAMWGTPYKVLASRISGNIRRCGNGVGTTDSSCDNGSERKELHIPDSWFDDSNRSGESTPYDQKSGVSVGADWDCPEPRSNEWLFECHGKRLGVS
jgi:hypothetical protein